MSDLLDKLLCSKEYCERECPFKFHGTQTQVDAQREGWLVRLEDLEDSTECRVHSIAPKEPTFREWVKVIKAFKIQKILELPHGVVVLDSYGGNLVVTLKFAFDHVLKVGDYIGKDKAGCYVIRAKDMDGFHEV